MAELKAIPAVNALAEALELAAQLQDAATRRDHDIKSTHVEKLPTARHLGWWLLTPLRLVDSHVYFQIPHVLRNGLTAAAVTAAVRAAATAIVECSASAGRIILAEDDVLMFKSEQGLLHTSSSTEAAKLPRLVSSSRHFG